MGGAYGEVVGLRRGFDGRPGAGLGSTCFERDLVQARFGEGPVRVGMGRIGLFAHRTRCELGCAVLQKWAHLPETVSPKQVHLARALDRGEHEIHVLTDPAALGPEGVPPRPEQIVVLGLRQEIALPSTRPACWDVPLSGILDMQLNLGRVAVYMGASDVFFEVELQSTVRCGDIERINVARLQDQVVRGRNRSAVIGSQARGCVMSTQTCNRGLGRGSVG